MFWGCRDVSGGAGVCCCVCFDDFMCGVGYILSYCSRFSTQQGNTTNEIIDH